MSNNSALNSKGFKWSITSLAATVALISALTPYFNVVAEAKAQAIKISDLEKLQKQDHDALIRMSADLHYVKEHVGDIKLLLQQRQKTQ